MDMFASVIVICLAGEWLYGILMEDIHKTTKEIMNYERDFIPKRQNVIRGMFRQHNQHFRSQGIKPPEGHA